MSYLELMSICTIALQDPLCPCSSPCSAPTEVIALENTLNGTIIPQEEVIAISDFARSNNIKMHLDGARLWHVAAETGVSLKELSDPFDSVSVCFSKGLGTYLHLFHLLNLLTDIPLQRCTDRFVPGRQQGTYQESPLVPKTLWRRHAADWRSRWMCCIRIVS